jgi:uncharacterized protein YifN (PemK superfamily)
MQKLPFHPRPGDILICDYSTGFRPPEMVKRRLCVVVSPKLKRRTDLATVVPISQTCPDNPEPWHHRIDLVSQSWGDGPRWIACDMIATVAYDRLSRPHFRHPVTGSRVFERLSLSQDDVIAVQNGIRAALGLGN